MTNSKNELLGGAYPSRLRLFFGFIGIAFASLVDAKNAAEVLALGLDAKGKLERKRYMERQMRDTKKPALRITGCTDPFMWYAGKVGEVVPFLREESDCYISREPAGYTNIVRKKDAQIVYT